MKILELIFGRSKHQDDIDYYSYLNSDVYKKAQEEENIEKQKLEDDRVQMALEMDAHQQFIDWNFGKIFVSNPNTIGIYYIHHDNYKWKDNTMKSYKQAYFNKLKEEAVAKVDLSIFKDYKKEDLEDYRIYQILERAEIEALRKHFNIENKQ